MTVNFILESFKNIKTLESRTRKEETYNKKTSVNNFTNIFPLTKATSKIILQRWLALTALWIIGASFWSLCPFFKNILMKETQDVLWNCSFVYFFAGLIWEISQAAFNNKGYVDSRSQSTTFFETIFSLVKSPQQAIKDFSYEKKQSILFFTVRGFFLPVMLNTFVSHYYSFVIPASLTDAWTKFTNLNWMQDFVFFVDVIPFALAYLFNFGNFRTKSIDINFVGWFFCLACYPPFNTAFGEFFPFYHDDFSGWWGWISLAFIAVYSWASVALGLRSGHLQYRGLCQSGPYAIVRHPAYAFKTLSWWVGTIAWTSLQIQTANDLKQTSILIAWNLLSASFWTWIYHQRAVTEEKHLMKYEEYVNYCERVKYRYIPKFI
ncbi:MAG: hypothetical protein SFU25_04545 [Candidatus Caenarcaniphilales bacterium]|nr:hypothetical protein [Candidatus Caenarcaniphilales bacterium]